MGFFMDDRFLKRAIVLSVLAHLLLAFSCLVWQSLQTIDLTRSNKEVVYIDLLPSNDSAKNRIVESSKGVKVEKAVPDSYLGKENRVVDQQSVAKPREETTKQAAKGGRKSKAEKSLDRLGLAILPKADMGATTSSPEWVEYGDRFGGADKHEYVKGVKETEATALNTKEFIYFGYFQRVRQQLDQAWRPLLKSHLVSLYSRGRSPASDMDHTTRTVVTLDEKGSVVKVEVIEASGTRELDRAAIKAFNAAGPFPNPPKGLIANDGLVKIRWDFILRT